MKTLNEAWVKSCVQFKDLPVVQNRKARAVKDSEGKIDEEVSFEKVSYKKLETFVFAFGNGLLSLGLKEKEAVAIIAENSMRWLISDLAVLGNRAYDVPRGCSSTVDEIIYILNHSDSRIVIVDDENQLNRLLERKNDIEKVETFIVLDETFKKSDPKKLEDTDDEEKSGKIEKRIFSYDQVLTLGKEYWKDEQNKKKNEFQTRRENTQPDDNATLIYTSGTSGEPKGIMLTHWNIMHIVETVPFIMNVHSDDVFLSILPVWHTFERTLEYCVIRVGASLAYTNRLTVVKDMGVVTPTYLVGVPRIWLAIYNNVMANIRHAKKDKLFQKLYAHSKKVIQCRRYNSKRQYLLGKQKPKKVEASLKDYFYHYTADLLIYRKVREKLGGKLIGPVSGGGALPAYIDDFYEVIGVPIIEGYGLTETSPILCCRTFTHNIPYTVGQPIPQTTIVIKDEQGNLLPDGQKGCVWVSGPQVMKGYYKNEVKTNEVMGTDEKGKVWFNTGDLGVISHYGDISILGRIKDTIVLIGGENVEPERVETAIASSEYVEQALVCGQDQECITALIVPNDQELRHLCRELSVEFNKDVPALINEPKIKKFFKKMIKEKVSLKTGFKDIELVNNFTFTKPFTPEDETLTLSMKIRRHKVFERDLEKIKAMYPYYNDLTKGES